MSSLALKNLHLTNMAKLYPEFADDLLTCARNYQKFAPQKGLC